MMTNLFSMFDPSSSIFSLNWSMLPISIILWTSIMFSFNKIKLPLKVLIKSIKKETSPILGSKNFKISELILITLLCSIIILNLISMIPHNFTVNAHMMISFPTALIWWLSMMLFGWFKHSKTMIFHSIPTGTPTVLINFMLMIEMISNLIRPLTLSIRLSANMIAGHLLMNLLGSIPLLNFNFLMVLPSMIVLSILELAVSCIQAYVFMMLMTLYSTEMI